MWFEWFYIFILSFMHGLIGTSVASLVPIRQSCLEKNSKLYDFSTTLLAPMYNGESWDDKLLERIISRSR